MIDPTISLGAILNALALLVGFAVAFAKLGGRIDLLSQRIGAVEETLKYQRDVSERISVIEVRQATHGQMIAMAQNDIRDIKHGRGFVTPRSDGGINGEYP